MGEIVFGSMSSGLLKDDEWPKDFPRITEQDYDQWQREYVWDALQDQRFGQSFCRAFGIKDFIVYYERDWVRADAYIRRNYIARS